MQEVKLQVADEVKAAADAIAAGIGAAKAGQSFAQIASSVLPGMLASLSGMANVGGDIKLVDNQVYIIYALAKVFEGQ